MLKSCLTFASVLSRPNFSPTRVISAIFYLLLLTISLFLCHHLQHDQVYSFINIHGVNCTSTNLPPAMEVAHREEFQKRGRFRSRYRRIKYVSTSSHVIGAHQKLFWRTWHKDFRKKKIKAAHHCLKFQAVSHNYSGLCQGRWQRKTTHRLVVMATVSCQTDCVEIGQVWTKSIPPPDSHMTFQTQTVQKNVLVARILA